MNQQQSNFSDDDEWGDDSSIPSYGANSQYQLPVLQHIQSYKVLNIEDITKRQLQMSEQISDIFSKSQDQTWQLLMHFNWLIEKFKEKFLDQSSQKKILIDSGVWLRDQSSNQNPYAYHQTPLKEPQNYCFVCFSQVEKVYGIQRCGHEFCHLCWSNYIKTKIDEGPQEAIKINCPNVECNLLTPVSIVKRVLTYLDPSCLELSEKQINSGKKKLTPSQYLKTYQKYLAMSFTSTNNKFVKWCPAPGCQFALQAIAGKLSLNAQCNCGTKFCLRCGKECHIPISCQLAQSWQLKNQNESQNATWLTANTKICPGCKKPIQKNHGCNHMTCRCGYQFCWLCLMQWKAHGGYGSACRQYNLEQQESKQKGLQDIKSQLQRYMYFYERYQNHHRSLKMIQDLIPQLQQNMNELHKRKNIPLREMQFIIRAAQSVIKARGILRWSYAYGYFLKDQKQEEKLLLQFQQQKLDANCDYLHELLERPFKPFYVESDDNALNKQFFKYKDELQGVYQVTETFYKNFSEGLEMGLTANFY